MSVRKGFRRLEHTADEYIMAFGNSLEEDLESAAVALSEVMTDSRTVGQKIREEIRIEAEDEKSLLYSWLESILIKFDAEGKLYSKFDVSKIEENGNVFCLESTIWGEVYNPEKHPSRTGVKAITYYKMEIIKEKGKVSAKFLLDI